MEKAFDNFNSARTIAAMAVLVAYIELQKPINGFERFTFINLIPLGTIAVILFFVLSGFLITFLILQERQQQNSFDIRKFYVRRALRIWPLYFLVIAAALLISFSSQWLKKIGIVSYGLYLIHSFVIYYILYLFLKNNTIGSNIFLYLLIAGVSILLSLIIIPIMNPSFFASKRNLKGNSISSI